jgi:hypothetical protein
LSRVNGAEKDGFAIEFPEDVDSTIDRGRLLKAGGGDGCATRHPQQGRLQYDGSLRRSRSIVFDLELSQVKVCEPDQANYSAPPLTTCSSSKGLNHGSSGKAGFLSGMRADRQDRVGVAVRRDAHRFVALLRISDVPRRQGRSETRRARRQQHILYRRIDRCAIGTDFSTLLQLG